MFDFNALKKNLKKDFSPLKKIRVALIGDSSTQLLAQAVRGCGFEMGVNFELFDADYNQIEQQVFDSSSDLYSFNPDYIILFHSVEKFRKKFYDSKNEEKFHFANHQINKLSEINKLISSKIPAKILYLNFPEINDSVFGNYSNKVENSLIFQVRKFNYELMNLSITNRNFFIVDISLLQNQFGRNFVFDPKIYVSADMVFSVDFLPRVAKNITDIILSVSGNFKKCLILDLDNTMWGGIIGDDGIENIHVGDLGIGKAFTEFQLWAKQLKERGIILAVCSKNLEAVAKEPFEKHPDMVLKLEDIAVFVANWESKVDNIKYIREILNIGFDSMVFVDDNPYERNIVRHNLPEVTVPELPEDPAHYLEYLRTLNLFETASFSEEDSQRTQQYQEESRRLMEQRSYTDENDFLAGLEMVSTIKAFDKFDTPRIAQLSQRANQFNLRTVRYTEEDIQRIAESENHITFTFTLRDRFGENGLICIIILEKCDKETAFIDTWLMSCRVLKKGMENFTLNTIATFAKKAGFKKLAGEYIPTTKNMIVKDHYANLGFTQENGKWFFDLENFSEKNSFIKAEFIKR